MYEQIKTEIQKSYTSFLNKAGFKARFPQKLMMAKIANALADVEEDAEFNLLDKNPLALIEAGTGVGKTLAYLLTGINFALAKQKKLVVATATVALQEQIVFRDLPNILEKTDLDIKFALAKGRARYVCLAKLSSMTTQRENYLSTDLMPAPSDGEEAVLEKLLTLFSSGEWDGDRDSLDFSPAGVWQKLTADNRSCTKKRCPFFLKSCPYYRAREEIEKATVIIANQNLLLTDLSLGGGVLLPPPKQSIFVIDEAHNLPQKALSAFTATYRIKVGLNIHKSLHQELPKLSKAISKENHIVKNIIPLINKVGESVSHLEFLLQSVENMGFENAKSNFVRMFREDFSKSFLNLCSQIKGLFFDLKQRSERLLDDIKELPDETYNLQAWFTTLEVFIGNLERGLSLFDYFTNFEEEQELPIARWIDLHQEKELDFELSASPVLASEALRKYFWSEAYAAILTSATLSAPSLRNARSFEHFLESSGLPEWTKTYSLPSPFDYQNNSVLFIPKIALVPTLKNNAEVDLMTLDYLQNILQKEVVSALVLFNSRLQMQRVLAILPQDLADLVLTQDDSSKQDILQKHKQKIDLGERSILFGLASFAEGIDLPGDYLQEVAIIRLPFSHPEDPIKQSLKDWFEKQGRNFFFEEVLPETGLKLIQACGRLIRSETDKGRIVILDRRLVSTNYGNTLRASLPPFKFIAENPLPPKTP